MRLAVLFASLSLLACSDVKPPEDDIPGDLDAKADSFHTPTDHGIIPFATAELGKLAAGQGYHTWEFQLSAESRIHAFTSRAPHYANLDSVLYLYKQTAATGAWGPYLARNDDDGRAHWSSLDRTLEAGNYRVLVKGYAAATAGRFDVQVDCDSDFHGCLPPATCLFGRAVGEIQPSETLLVYTQRVFTPVGLAPIDAQRTILALHESAHTDVTTVEEAFEAADQNEIDFTRIYDLVSARSFTVVDYGAGDNTYGAIYAEDTLDRVAGVHDSDLVDCTIERDTCLLGQSFGELRDDPHFMETTHTTITMASQLSGVAADQALAAIRVAYQDATSLANGLTQIDQGQLEVRTFLHVGTGTLVDSFDYGAGDNTYGELFFHGSTDVAAAIHDGDFYACSLFVSNTR